MDTILLLTANRHILDIGIPSAGLREHLWKKLLPKKAPVASNIDFEELAQR